jgi:hypothetical protein
VAGAAIGAVAGLAVGAAAATVVPPLAPAIVAGVTGAGALAGSVAGAVAATDGGTADDGVAPTRRGGLAIAVRVEPESETLVADLLRDAGATGLERASGQWRDGHWADFDPLQPPQPIDPRDERQ